MSKVTNLALGIEIALLRRVLTAVKVAGTVEVALSYSKQSLPMVTRTLRLHDFRGRIDATNFA